MTCRFFFTCSKLFHPSINHVYGHEYVLFGIPCILFFLFFLPPPPPPPPFFFFFLQMVVLILMALDFLSWSRFISLSWSMLLKQREIKTVKTYTVFLYTVSILHSCGEESQWIRFGGIVTGTLFFWLKWESVCLWMCTCMLACKGAHARVCLCLCFSTRMHSNTKYTQHLCHISWGVTCMKKMT